MKYRTDIDGLRAIAVTAVIVNHIEATWMPNGYLGVDIFFVISGFVITQSLVDHADSSFGEFIRGFYTRRAKRLLPALFACVGLTSLFVLLISTPGSELLSDSINTGIAALFGLANMYLLHQALDYFGSSAELNLFTHTWSLGVEEQFYLLFPFLLWLTGLTKGQGQSKWLVSALLVLAGVASLGLYHYLSRNNAEMAFYLMPTRFWELAAGFLAFIVSSPANRILSHSGKTRQAISALALLALGGVLFYPGANIEYVTYAVVALSVLLVLILQPGLATYRLLTLKPVVYIGLISYSLYLWHWSVLAVSRWTIGVNAETLPFQLAVMFLLAASSYHLLEKPLRRRKWSLALPGKRWSFGTVSIGLATACFLAASLTWVAMPLHRRGYLYTGEPAPLIRSGVHTLRHAFKYNNQTWTGKNCVIAENYEIDKQIVPERCTLGASLRSGHSQRRFLVIGDSFSAAQIDMFQAVLDQQLGSVTLVAAWDVSPAPGMTNDGPRKPLNEHYWQTVVPRLLALLEPGDVVVMIFNAAPFSPKSADTALQQRLAEIRSGLHKLLPMLQQKEVAVIYQSGLPLMRETGCTPEIAMSQWWHFSFDPPCTYYSREETLRRRQPFHDELLKLQDKYPHFFVLDLMDVYCPGKQCTYSRDNGATFLFRDMWSHSSVEANRLAQPFLLEAVDTALQSVSGNADSLTQ